MSTAVTTAPSAVSNLTKQIRVNIQTYALIGAIVVLWILFTFTTAGGFASPQNFSNLFRQMTVTALLSVGMVLVIVTGNIDLSVGNLAGFVSVMVASTQAQLWPQLMGNDRDPAIAAVLSVIVGLAVGLLAEAVQGYIIAYQRVPAFIVTLGGMWVFKGLLLIRTEGKTIPANQPVFSDIAQGYLPALWGWILAAAVVALLFWSMYNGRARKRRYGFELTPLWMDLAKTILFSILIAGYVFIVNQYNGVQIPVLILAIAAVVVSYLSNNTTFGRYTYAIGGNREAARLSGVNIRRNIFMVFVLMGFLCGVSGIVLASYVGYGTIAAGNGYELDAIAGCILGGTSPLGGEGTIFGAMIGSLIMATLTNGLQMMNVQPAWQYLVKGAVLVLAVWADVKMKRR